MNRTLEQIGLAGIVPVVVIDNEAEALPLAEALLKGGLATMEITFRTPAAARSLECIAKFLPAVLPGAGTILTAEQAKTAIEAGAKYVVSPGMNAAVVEYCRSRGVAALPGVMTPTEIQAALTMGLEAVKFFPAEPAGGIGYLRSVAAVFRTMKFVPTGGIDETNVGEYLAHPQVLACGGSWMVKQQLIASKKFDEITRLAERAASLAGVRVPPGSATR